MKKIAQNPINSGLKAFFIFCIIFLAWAIFLPISSAVIAQGTVNIDFNSKTIQHLEGGIIEKILVKEGQFVKKGQNLLFLNDIKAKSDQNSISTKLKTLKLQKKRLIAEKNNAEFNATGQDDASLTQKQLFNARTLKKQGQELVFKEKLSEFSGILQSLKWQKKAISRKLTLIKSQLTMIHPLVESEDLSLTEEIDLEKQYIDTKTKELEISAQINKTKRQIAQTKLEMANYNNENLVEILDQLKESESEIATLTNELNKTQDLLTRSAIIAPVSGTVMNIKYHTIGAVIQSGSPIMTIIPKDKNLIIAAKIMPQDIDSVHKNMHAKVILSAYKDKKVPKLQGQVINVSGDILTEEKTGQPYYLARIKILESELKKLKTDIKITPGMPAQVFVITGSRVFLDYLFAPIRDSAYKAFRQE